MKYIVLSAVLAAFLAATPAAAQFGSYQPDAISGSDAQSGRNAADPNPALETSNERRTTLENRRGVYSTRDLAFRRCNAPADCAVVTPACSGPTAVNRAFADGFAPGNASGAPMTCHTDASQLRYTADCVGGLCTVSSANTQPRFRPTDTKFCYSDGDCRVNVDSCGRKTAVNERFFAVKSAQTAGQECTSWTDNRPADVRCQHNKCTVLFGRPPE
ncbi:MAG TPA: hypothetical protein VEF76_04275 [Patescibacteria group bacterium]|nr:hypothetical protein [Patescibacteria group bacterium]